MTYEQQTLHNLEIIEESLNEVKNELMKKLEFVNTHNFKNEANHIREKKRIVEEILALVKECGSDKDISNSIRWMKQQIIQ